MWRFILVTFGFLGFAFWEMSGGADYAPRENLIQVQANSSASETAVAATEPETPPKPEKIGLPQQDNADRFQITLASISKLSEAGTAQETARTERVEDKARFLTQPETSEDNAVLAALDQGGEAADDVKRHWPGAIELFEQQASQTEMRKQAEAAARSARSGMTGADIRYVTASSANMRGGPSTDYARVGNLSEGVEVAVLGVADNGWLELEVVNTGETGWMADWLVSDPAQ